MRNLRQTGKMTVAVTSAFLLMLITQVMAGDAYDYDPLLDTPAKHNCISAYSEAASASCWYAQADAVWLQRDQGQLVFLVERHNTAGVPNSLNGGITSHSIEFDYELGARFVLGRRLNDCCALEISYFGLQDWDASASVTTNDLINNPLQSPLLPLTSNGVFQFAGRVDAAFSSEFHSAELLAKRDVCGSAVTLTGGVRFFHLEDDLVLTSYNNALQAFEQGSIQTSNDLIGLELGAERDFRWHRLSLGLFGKAGLFLNFTNQTMQDGSVNFAPPAALAPNPIISTDFDGTSLAGMIDVGIRATVHLNDHLFIRGGYQVMLLSGVALAPEQMPLLGSAGFPARVTNATFPGGVNDSGLLVLNGCFAGFGAEW